MILKVVSSEKPQVFKTENPLETISLKFIAYTFTEKKISKQSEFLKKLRISSKKP